jgi:hypothetical protein
VVFGRLVLCSFSWHCVNYGEIKYSYERVCRSFEAKSKSRKEKQASQLTAENAQLRAKHFPGQSAQHGLELPSCQGNP